jgi:type III secretion system FlhB-like substrate exporter
MSRTLAVEDLNHNTDLKSSLPQQLYATLTDIFSGAKTILFGF